MVSAVALLKAVLFQRHFVPSLLRSRAVRTCSGWLLPLLPLCMWSPGIGQHEDVFLLRETEQLIGVQQKENKMDQRPTVFCLGGKRKEIFSKGHTAVTGHTAVSARKN